MAVTWRWLEEEEAKSRVYRLKTLLGQDEEVSNQDKKEVSCLSIDRHALVVQFDHTGKC